MRSPPSLIPAKQRARDVLLSWNSLDCFEGGLVRCLLFVFLITFFFFCFCFAGILRCICFASLSGLVREPRRRLPPRSVTDRGSPERGTAERRRRDAFRTTHRHSRWRLSPPPLSERRNTGSEKRSLRDGSDTIRRAPSLLTDARGLYDDGTCYEQGP